jgi:hypothetical protein
LSATPTHSTGHPHRPEHLAGITGADAGLAKPLARNKRSTSRDLPHQPPDLPQRVTDVVNRSTGLPLAVTRRRRPDALDVPHQPAELPEQIVGPTSRNRGITEPEPRHHFTGPRQGTFRQAVTAC